MDYETVLYQTDTIADSLVVRQAVGCLDYSCTVRNVTRPKVHFTLGTWNFGAQFRDSLPAEIQPILISTMDYVGKDSYFPSSPDFEPLLLV